MDNDSNKIEEKLEKILSFAEKTQIAEYVELVNNPRKMLLINLLSGIARGIGGAIGFILFGAIMIWFLGRLALLNIPIIGDYITEIVKIVMDQL